VGDDLVTILWNKIAALTGGTNEWPFGLGLRPWYLQVPSPLSHLSSALWPAVAARVLRCAHEESGLQKRRACPCAQGFSDVNGTGSVHTSEIPAWVKAQALSGNAGQGVDGNGPFTIPVGDVSGTNPFTSGQNDGACGRPSKHLLAPLQLAPDEDTSSCDGMDDYIPTVVKQLPWAPGVAVDKAGQNWCLVGSLTDPGYGHPTHGIHFMSQ
jgi:hypothetical protein